MDKNKCPKCGGEMEEGIFVDRVQMASREQTWGSKIKLAGLGVENEKKIKSYRCKSCGYLESYAK